MNIYQNTHTNSDMGLLPYRCAATRVFAPEETFIAGLLARISPVLQGLCAY